MFNRHHRVDYTGRHKGNNWLAWVFALAVVIECLVACYFNELIKLYYTI